MTRDAERDILARIRHASRRADADTVRAALVQLPAVPAARLDDPDPLLAFVMRVLRNGGTAAVCSSRRDAVAAIGELVAERHGQRRVVAGHDARLAALPWRDGGLLPRFGTAEDGDAVTVSWAHRAVAETGSVLLTCDRNNPASNNLLSEDHVVLVDAGAVVTRLEDAFEDLALDDPTRRPRGMMLISGPSSTADIALQMVMGAHGPRAWHVIVIGPDLDPDLPARAQALLRRS